MKLSKSKLNQIIMEEYVTVKREAFRDSPEDKEKDDLLGLYSDVWKYKHGTRPRGKMQWMFDNMTADEIGQEIDDLFQSIRDKESAEAEYEAEAARRAEEEAELGRMMPDPDDLEDLPKQEPIRRPVRESKMKLTKTKLKQIIREELNEVMNLDFGSPEDLPTGAFGAEDPDVIAFNDEEDVIEYIEGLTPAFKKIGLPMADVTAALRSFQGSLVEFMNGVMTNVQSTYGGPTLAKGTHENEVAKKVAAELGLKSAQAEPKAAGGDTLKSLYRDYVSDHKKEKAAGLIDRYSSEWNRTAANFLDYLEHAGGGHVERAEDGFREEGIAFFNKLGIPLKR